MQMYPGVLPTKKDHANRNFRNFVVVVDLCSYSPTNVTCLFWVALFAVEIVPFVFNL
jgi:hypothetical protein